LPCFRVGLTSCKTVMKSIVVDYSVVFVIVSLFN
jgi:hypothetical protein